MQFRLFACLFVITTIAASWLGMTALHEARPCDQRLAERRPGDECRTAAARGWPYARFAEPASAICGLGGAFWGSLLGVSAMLLARSGDVCRWFGRFFAGVCLIANGAYLGLGGLFGDANGADDAHELLRQGASLWELLLFGLLATAAGLAVWHRLGPRLGLLRAVQHADWKMLAVLLALTGVLLCAGYRDC